MVAIKICEVSIDHLRLTHKKHAFSYRGWALQIDGDQLESSCQSLWPILRQGRGGVFSIYFPDYIPLVGAGLTSRIAGLLRTHGLSFGALSVTMLTMPRFLGYVFNPVTFYLCREHNKNIAFIAEVRNTFGEMHHYVMPVTENSLPLVFEFPKKMYVSPFYDVSGSYRLTVNRFDDAVDVCVELLRAGEEPFLARVTGRCRPASRAALLLMLLKYPLFIPLIMIRIHYQALKLFLRRAGFLEIRPQIYTPGTIQTSESIWYSLRTSLVMWLRKIWPVN